MRSVISKKKMSAIALIKLKDKLERRIAKLQERLASLIRALDRSVKDIAEKETPNAL